MRPSDLHPARALTARDNPPDRLAVSNWLFGVAGLLWLMVALGGATRLSGSGLSIMEWAPLTGALPPLSAREWNRLYDLYRSIPQYSLVNQGFGLEGFKAIFWLEWAHRLLGRLIGLAYAGPLLWFWLRGRIPAGYRWPLLGLLLLGGMQGGVGWFMVASGFEDGRTAVSPYRLVLHLGLAMTLFAAILWTALSLRAPLRMAMATDPAVRWLLHGTVLLVAATMLAGGFVAGLRAGLDYNTFPLMDGRLVPEGYAALQPAWRNWTENIAAVQFHHRVAATLTLLAGLATAMAARLRLPAGGLRRACLLLGGGVLAQYALGVITLLHRVPASLGTLHQAVAMLVLAAAIIALHAARSRAAAVARRPSLVASAAAPATLSVR